MYLEVFSFKLHAALSDRPENYISGVQNHNKHNLHVCILYINVIISYSFRVCSQHGAWMNATMFIVIVKVLSTAVAIGWTIPRGSTVIAEHITWRHSSWLKKTSSLAVWNLRQYCHFCTIQTSICCIDCLVIANICTYISLHIRNTAISVNKKLVCISPH